MIEQNNINSSSNVVKIVLAAVIGFFSLILLAVGIIYIVSMQNKISKLEKEQQEVMKRQLETQNMALVQTVPQSQPVKKESKKTQNTEKNSQSSEPVIFFIDGTGDEDGIVSVRLEPNEESEFIADLSNGESVEYLGKKGDWYYVKYDGGKGYVHKSRLKR